MEARELESAVLGAILYHGDLGLLRKVAQVVTAADFGDRGRVVFEAALRLAGQGVAPTVPAVVHHLDERGELARAGGASSLDTVADMGDPINAVHWAGELRRVRLAAALRAAAADLGDSITPAQLGAVREAAEALRGAFQGDPATDPERGTAADFVAEVTASIGQRQAPLGLLGGWCVAPGELCVMVGPQKLGKSALAVQAADTVAQEYPALYITCEMPPREVWARVLAHRTPRDGGRDGEALFYSRVMRGELTANERETLLQQAERYTGSLRVIQPEPSRADHGSADWVARVVEAEAERLGVAPFVVVDYLQRLRQPSQRERRLEVGEVAYTLRALVDRLRVPMLAVASVARGKYPTARTEWEPPAEDIAKESGDVEYSATSLYALWPSRGYHAHYIKGGEELPGDGSVDVELHRLLHRHGGSGPRVLTLSYCPGYGRFQKSEPY